jgi:HAD superfamily hydrolase (TIGR01509 family)
MSTSPNAVLFDIDGTLVDSNYLHVQAWEKAVDGVGRSVDSWRIHAAIGKDSSLLMEAILPGADDETAEKASDLHSLYYKELAERLEPLSGARDLIRAVAERGMRVVLATSAPEDELKMLRDILDVEEQLFAVTSSEDVETAKPRPDIVQVALERAGVDADHAVFVGDTVWDVEAAAKAGVSTIGVRSGGIGSAELREAGAVEVYDDAADILAHLDSSPIAALPAD